MQSKPLSARGPALAELRHVHCMLRSHVHLSSGRGTRFTIKQTQEVWSQRCVPTREEKTGYKETFKGLKSICVDASKHAMRIKQTSQPLGTWQPSLYGMCLLDVGALWWSVCLIDVEHPASYLSWKTLAKASHNNVQIIAAWLVTKRDAIPTQRCTRGKCTVRYDSAHPTCPGSQCHRGDRDCTRRGYKPPCTSQAYG